MPDIDDKITTPRVDVYTVIANHWEIPRHRVKHLITAGAYGMAGSEKTVEQWTQMLDAWDETAEKGLAVEKAPTAVVKKRGRFKSNIKTILGI